MINSSPLGPLLLRMMVAVSGQFLEHLAHVMRPPLTRLLMRRMAGLAGHLSTLLVPLNVTSTSTSFCLMTPCSKHLCLLQAVLTALCEQRMRARV